MHIAQYPPQVPLHALLRPYHEQVLDLSRGIAFEEFHYGRDPYQGVLVARPEAPTGDVLAFLHGGGWINGYKEWMSFMAPAFTARGIIFASIGYRLAPAVMFPRNFHDVMNGFSELRRRIHRYGGNTERIFVGGHSAGGHLAALLAVSRGWREARGLPEDVICGCLPVSGLFDFRPGNGMPVRPRFLGSPNTNHALRASPVANIELTPPFFMAWGSADFPHIPKHGMAMANALAAAGGSVKTMVLAGCEHMQTSLESGKPDGQWFCKAVEWMEGIGHPRQ